MAQCKVNSRVGSLIFEAQAADAASLRTPRPTPKFFFEAEQLSTKKARATPRDQVPPRPPVKSAPIRYTRVHRTDQVASTASKALAISFRNGRDNSIRSKHYDEKLQESFFDQCFVVISLLGTGSFGEVYKVRSKEDGRYYAVKKSKERFRGAIDRQLQIEEVRKLEQLPKHPNCIRFIRAWEERQRLFIQTELCATSLSNFADQNHDISERLIWKYTVDLLQAVKHLHDHDLIHLDLKPANIFVSEMGVCKLGDFGLVTDLRKGETADAQDGDPKYLAPEIMQGKFTKAADIFSLGITILELAGDLDLPKGGDSWQQMRKGHLPQEFIKHLSSDLKSLILSMMHPDYRERPTVDDLLQNPVIKRVFKWRKYELTFKSMITNASELARFSLTCIAFIWFVVAWPWSKLFRFMGSRKPLHKTTPRRTLFDMDCTFSDDEALLMDEFCASTASKDIPALDLSTTSGESNENSFTMPDVSACIINSTPAALRHRGNMDRSCSLTAEFDCFSYSPKPDHSVECDDELSKMSGARNLLDDFDSISDDD